MTSKDLQALWLLISGFTAWSVAFILLYALQALGCAYGWEQHRAIVLVAGGISLIPLVFLSVHAAETRGEPATTLSRIALWANRAALAAGVLVLVAPATFVSLCD